MSKELKNFGKTVNAAAYEMALALANKDSGASTPEKLLEKIDELFPTCQELLTKRSDSEKPQTYFGK